MMWRPISISVVNAQSIITEAVNRTASIQAVMATSSRTESVKQIHV